MTARHIAGVVLAAAVAWWVAPRAHSQAQPFVPGCTVPFQPEPHEIDAKCGRQGDPTGSAEGKLQNEFKTNYCASGTPIEVTAFTFQTLQDAVDILKQNGDLHYGSPQNEPRVSERPTLSDLHITNPAGESVGEGKLVHMVAYLLHADFSGGETVNCNGSGSANPLPTKQEFGDIHVYLSKTKPTRYTSEADRKKKDCRSMTAEIIPHLRPEAFDKIGQFHDTQSGAKAFDRIAAAKLNRPMRFTGHMFFDGAHTPCSSDSDQTTTPRRFSSWEIHPIYAMEVCKFTTKAKCRVDHDLDWTSFAAWMKGIEGEDQ